MSEAWKSLNISSPTEEHAMLRETARQWAREVLEPQALEHDRKEIFNLELFRSLGELGFLGITVPEEYGGSGMDATAAAIVHEELSAVDPGFTLAYLAHAMLCVNNLAVNGSEEQKKKYLPGLCSGELVGAMAMSEPDYGTDVMGMETEAKKVDGGYVINGRKMWITNGCIDDEGTACDVLWLYARTGVDSKGRPQISTFIVEKGTAGFNVGQKIKDKTGMRASNTAELILDQCKLTSGQLVGQEGGSLTHMMRNLEIERLTLAAMSLGIARRSLEIMNKYAAERISFGKPLNAFGQIQRHIAESFAEFRCVQAYLYDVARKMDINSHGQRLDSDGVKLMATTLAKNIADRGIQVLGGYGYVGEYVVERLWRDAKLLEIGGGTLEAHQKNITRDLAKNPEILMSL